MDVTLGVRPGDDGTVVAVSGEVDVCTEAPLQQALLRIMREHGARLLLDVSGVSFMDCAGLRALQTTRRRAELHGGFMRLIAVSRAVRRIIELTGAHEAFRGADRHGPFGLVLFTERTGCGVRSEVSTRPSGLGRSGIRWQPHAIA